MKGASTPDPAEVSGVVFNIQRFSLHDGPGIRTIVFLKGCPLSCRWCDNPESQSLKPELALFKARCTGCGKCLPICPEQAIALDNGAVSIDFQRCLACGLCLEACYPKALMIYGAERTAREVFQEVIKDKIYYQGSRGGLTISGGEPLSQPRFAAAILHLCRAQGVHTCIETSGYGSAEALGELLEFTDLVLFDLKHLDTDIHRQYSGQRNDLIMANARLVVASPVPVIWRLPLIPGVNDTRENIKETADFIKAMGRNPEIEVLPYHRLGVGKYLALGKRYPLDAVNIHPPEKIAWVRQTFEEFGVQCRIIS